MLKRSPKKSKQKSPQQARQAPAQQAAPPRPSTPAQEYARLGTDAPIAWPSVGGRRVPVTGQLSPHAQAALKRMGITKD
jgi:hypothetical protein